MNHPDSVEDYAEALARAAGGAPPRLVQTMDGTQKENPYANVRSGGPLPSSDPDNLFGASLAYQSYKKEKPEHRLMLWLRLQGHNVKETAHLTGYTPQSVSQICKQPWFVEAFVRLAKEVGKDAVTTFLEGEVLPALQRTVELARSAETHAVQLAANREILDRFLGKSVARIESRSTGTLDVNVLDAAALLKEQARNAEILKGRGIGAN